VPSCLSASHESRLKHSRVCGICSTPWPSVRRGEPARARPSPAASPRKPPQIPRRVHRPVVRPMPGRTAGREGARYVEVQWLGRRVRRHTRVAATELSPAASVRVAPPSAPLVSPETGPCSSVSEILAHAAKESLSLRGGADGIRRPAIPGTNTQGETQQHDSEPHAASDPPAIAFSSSSSTTAGSAHRQTAGAPGGSSRTFVERDHGRPDERQWRKR